MLKGSLVALVTPFNKGQIDEESLRELIEFHIENGTNGIVPCGTTGESPTLSHEEHKRVVEITVEQVKGRVPVVAGAGSNSTAEAIDLTKHAKQVGADAALHVTPYYNKPTQEGIFTATSQAIAKEAGFPLVPYNIAGRTGHQHRAGHPGPHGRAARDDRLQGGQRQHQPDGRDLQPVRRQDGPACPATTTCSCPCCPSAARG